MEWTPGGVSDDIEDRRDESGGGGGFGFGGWHMGCGGLILIGILSLIFHTNLFTLLSPQPGTQTVQTRPDYAQDQREQPEVEFVSFVLDDVQKNWARILLESERWNWESHGIDGRSTPAVSPRALCVLPSGGRIRPRSLCEVATSSMEARSAAGV